MINAACMIIPIIFVPKVKLYFPLLAVDVIFTI